MPKSRLTCEPADVNEYTLVIAMFGDGNRSGLPM
jgi:hypothetical protein